MGVHHTRPARATMNAAYYRRRQAEGRRWSTSDRARALAEVEEPEPEPERYVCLDGCPRCADLDAVGEGSS